MPTVLQFKEKEGTKETLDASPSCFLISSSCMPLWDLVRGNGAFSFTRKHLCKHLPMPQETLAPQITHIISHNPHGSQQDHLLGKRTETQNRMPGSRPRVKGEGRVAVWTTRACGPIPTGQPFGVFQKIHH